MIKVGIIGGTGYTGAELLRLLAFHDCAEVVAVTSRAEVGVRVDQLYPNLRGICDLVFSDPEQASLDNCDVVFYATPHGVAMHTVSELLEKGGKVIDLSGDFRLTDVSVWEHWYGQKHVQPDLISEAVYGLPELNRHRIKDARLVACPGCYPTAVQLAFLPLLEAGLIDTDRLIANAASGVSGAGRQAKLDNLYTEVSDSFKAYGVSGHRHLPEIEQGLSQISGGDVKLTFVPHLLPTVRGILTTAYAELSVEQQSLEQLQSIFERRYANEPFVDILPAGSSPQTRSCRASNICQIAVNKPQDRETIVVLSAIDNLVKGASGQAIQNMNIMFGFDEAESLRLPAALP